MEFLPEALELYVEQHTAEETDLLRQLNRETNARIMMPRMLSGHLQGRFLAMMSHMIKPKNILEIGTYTGYSAICLAEGLQEGGTLYTIDINEELEDLVRGYFDKAGIADKTQYHIGNALNIIPTLPGTFDLVFIDADKINYARYFDLVIERINIGGYILTDNVLWSGKILDDKKDKDTAAIDAFNKKLTDYPRVETVMVPIRDGILIARKTI
ncbi:O-methyltransferase [soil metagenome]